MKSLSEIAHGRCRKQGLGKGATLPAAEHDFPANKQLTGLADHSLSVKRFCVHQTELSLSISLRGAPLNGDVSSWEAEPGICSRPAMSLERMGKLGVWDLIINVVWTTPASLTVLGRHSNLI